MEAALVDPQMDQVFALVDSVTDPQKDRDSFQMSSQEFQDTWEILETALKLMEVMSSDSSDSSQLPEAPTSTLEVHTASASLAEYSYRDLTPTDSSTAAPEDNSLLNGTQGAVSPQIVFKSSNPMELDYFTTGRSPTVY